MDENRGNNYRQKSGVYARGSKFQMRVHWIIIAPAQMLCIHVCSTDCLDVVLLFSYVTNTSKLDSMIHWRSTRNRIF